MGGTWMTRIDGGRKGRNEAGGYIMDEVEEMDIMVEMHEMNATKEMDDVVKMLARSYAFVRDWIAVKPVYHELVEARRRGRG
jgi:hypothetical protein